MVKYLYFHTKINKNSLNRLAFIYYPLADDARVRRLRRAFASRPQANLLFIEMVVCAATFIALDWHFKLAAPWERRTPIPNRGTLSPKDQGSAVWTHAGGRRIDQGMLLKSDRRVPARASSPVTTARLNQPDGWRRSVTR